MFGFYLKYIILNELLLNTGKLVFCKMLKYKASRHNRLQWNWNSPRTGCGVVCMKALILKFKKMKYKQGI